MKRSKTPSFILTLPLQLELWQQDELDTIFEIIRKIGNAFLKKKYNQYLNIIKSKSWRYTTRNLAPLYEQRDKEKIDEDTFKKLAKPYFEIRKQILKDNHFTEFEFHKQINKYRHHFTKSINTHVAQKLASQIWKKFESLLYSNGKEIHFFSKTNFKSIEGKANNTGVYFKNNTLHVNKMKIKIRLPKDTDFSSSAIFERECLTHRIKYCRLTREWLYDHWTYFIQFILEGDVPEKINMKTEYPLHELGTGKVGYDIGTQTLAIVSDKNLHLVELASKCKHLDAQLKEINRAMDRSRKAMNPEFFDAKGHVIKTHKLPPELLKPNGKRRWKYSKRYKQLKSKRLSLYTKQRLLRKQQHQELANYCLTLGNEHYIETMRFKSLQKRSKKTTINQKTGRYNSKKRFGKSISIKAPALFVRILENKINKYHGTFIKINTTKARASQYNHLTQSYEKKKLSQRWNNMIDGNRIQRDLYSAFLIQNSNDTFNGFNQSTCEQKYNNFVKMHNNEINRLKTVNMPSSCSI